MHRAPSPPVDPPPDTSRPAIDIPTPRLARGKHAVLRSTDLLGTQAAVEIEHNGQRYRLQATRSGKLILTK